MRPEEITWRPNSQATPQGLNQEFKNRSSAKVGAPERLADTGHCPVNSNRPELKDVVLLL